MTEEFNKKEVLILPFIVVGGIILFLAFIWVMMLWNPRGLKKYVAAHDELEPFFINPND